METKEKTTNREQALQERMKAETERIVGELCQLYSPEMKDQLEQAYLETVTGDPEKASKLLLDVQAVKETDDIRFLQAVAYIRGEHFDDARALLLQINENEPNSPQVLTHLAHVEFAQRRYKKAVKYFEKVHAKQMQDFNYMFEYAVSLMLSGREQKARNVFMHIIEYVEQNDVSVSEFVMYMGLFWKLTCGRKTESFKMIRNVSVPFWIRSLWILGQSKACVGSSSCFRRSWIPNGSSRCF